MSLRLLIIVVLLVLPSGLFAQAKPAKTPVKSNTRPAGKPGPTPEPYDNATIEEMAKCVALETEKGTIEVMMFPETAPVTVRNFLNLTAIGAYDNTTFSRVVPDFVIQGGVLHTNKAITYEMSLRALKKLADEPNLVRHLRGIISMARGDEPNSASTSFFILVTRASSLDDKFAAFGRVVKGMDVVDVINKMPVVDEAPKEPVLISKATVKTCDPVSEAPSEVSNAAPEPAPKVNELPRFGLKGMVKKVSTISHDLKGNRTLLIDRRWGWKYSEAAHEFGELGDLLVTTYFDDNKSVVVTESYSSLRAEPDKPLLKKEIVRGPTGDLLREITISNGSKGTATFEAFDAEQNRIGYGEIKTDEDGRVLSIVWERFTKDDVALGKYDKKITYDAYGVEVNIVEKDDLGESAGEFTRYEYTDFDDRGNWIERKAYDSETAKKAVRVEKRVFEYYEEKGTSDR